MTQAMSPIVPMRQNVNASRSYFSGRLSGGAEYDHGPTVPSAAAPSALDARSSERAAASTHRAARARRPCPADVRRRRPPNVCRAQNGIRTGFASPSVEPTWTQHCWSRSTFIVQGSMNVLMLDPLDPLGDHLDRHVGRGP